MPERVCCFLVGLLVLLAGCRGEDPPPPEIPVGTAEGNRPPPLVGTLATGEPFPGIDASAGAAVIVFYRTASCGLCRVQLGQIEQNFGGYRQQGADVIGVTLDPPATSLALAGDLGLSFPLVSVDSSSFRDWGVLDPERGGPLPATYVLDDAGVIRFRHIGRNASDRTTDAGVLTILQTLSRE